MRFAAGLRTVRRKEVVSVPAQYDDYIPVGDGQPSDDSVSSVHYMVQGLLRSRIETGLSDDGSANEEDVNVYLTHLLCNWIDPRHHVHIGPYLERYDKDVFERVQQSTSDRLKLTVYKANADHLLLLLGIFQNASGRRPTSLPEPLRIRDDAHVGRGKTYYDFASTYSRSVFGRESGVTAVLLKLAFGFERYVRLLAHLRSEYLSLVQQMSDGEMYHLQHDIQGHMVSATYDEFLDALAEWRREPTAENHSRLQAIRQKLERIDSTFNFDVPEA